jgi:hypothetical protein
MSQFILAGKSNTQGITQTQFNSNTDYYGTSLDFGGAPIIAYATDVPDYSTNFYFNGQTLDSAVGGTASSVVVFDTTTGAPFESVIIPDAIKQGLQVPAYNYLEVSGTIPLSMNYQLNPNSASYGIGRLTCQGSDAGGATAKELTYWFSASNTANQTPTPTVGDSQWFCLVMKIGVSVLKTSPAIKFILANPDVNAYALGQGSRLIVAGGGISASTTNIQFKLF